MKANTKIAQTTRWYDRHYWALLLALTSLTIAYLVGSRSLNTGSWQQYGITFVLLVFGLNRLGRAAHTAATSLWANRSK